MFLVEEIIRKTIICINWVLYSGQGIECSALRISYPFYCVIHRRKFSLLDTWTNRFNGSPQIDGRKFCSHCWANLSNSMEAHKKMIEDLLALGSGCAESWMSKGWPLDGNDHPAYTIRSLCPVLHPDYTEVSLDLLESGRWKLKKRSVLFGF